MMRLCSKLLLLCAASSLVGCASLSSHTDTSYIKKGRDIPPLRVPVRVSNIKSKTYYPVPHSQMAPVSHSPSLVPPTLK